MNKKSFALLLAATTALAVTASAQTAMPAAAAPSSSWVITGSIASQYMFRGVRLGGPSFQPSAEYDCGPIVAGVWASVPISDKVPGQSNPEFDFYGSYSFEVVKDTFSVVPGATLYTYPSAKKANGFYKATFEPNVAANYTLLDVKFSGKLYYDFVLKGPTAEFGVGYTVPLEGLHTELDFAGTYGTYKWKAAVENASPEVHNWGKYFVLGVSAPFQINPQSKLTVGWAYTHGYENHLKQGTTPAIDNPGSPGRGVGTIAFAHTF